MNPPLLSQEMVKNIPIEFAPLLITGYGVPVNQIVPEDKIDEFLNLNPQYIQHTENKNGENKNNNSQIVEKIS